MADAPFSQRYELGEKLGSGGMGTVYRGVHRTLCRPVAIKFMNPDFLRDPQFQQRFLAEARVAAGLIHSNVTAVLDFGFAGSIPYLVTELVQGEPLVSILAARGALPVPDVVSITRQLLDGLSSIHALGIVHRDLKPANILVAEGSPPKVKILAFGRAKSVAGGGVVTIAGAIVGTPAYMAPEQAVQDPVSPATDLYSLTIIFYEMMVGHLPFRSERALDLVKMQIHDEPPIPDGLLPGLKDLLRKGLAKSPEERFPDAEAFRTAFDAAMGEARACGSFYQSMVQGETVAVAVPVNRTFSEYGSKARAIQPARSSGATAKLPVSAVPAVAPAALPMVPPEVSPVPSRGSRRVKYAVLILIGLCVVSGIAKKKQRLARSARPVVSESVSTSPAPATQAKAGAAEFGRVDDLIRRGLLDQGCQELTRIILSHPRSKETHPWKIGADTFSQSVDRALVSLLSSRMDTASRLTLPPAGDPPIPSGICPLLDELPPFLAAGNLARASALIGPFLKSPPREGEKAGEASALHHSNSLRWLIHVAELERARDVNSLMMAVGSLQLFLFAHPSHPVGFWSAHLLRDVMEIATVPESARAYDDQAWEIRTAVGVDPSGKNWPGMERAIERVRETVRKTWQNLGTLGTNPPDLRRALLMTTVVFSVRKEGKPPNDFVRRMLEQLDKMRHANGGASGPMPLDFPIPHRRILGVATSMGLRDSPLFRAVRQDAFEVVGRNLQGRFLDSRQRPAGPSPSR